MLSPMFVCSVGLDIVCIVESFNKCWKDRMLYGGTVRFPRCSVRGQGHICCSMQHAQHHPQGEGLVFSLLLLLL